jgi:isopentenyl phosphate kinase
VNRIKSLSCDETVISNDNIHKCNCNVSKSVLQVQNPVIVKLGGSVITHKDSSPPRVNEEHLSRIAKELTACSSPLILVLGGGAHGHQTAHKYGFGNPNTPSKNLLAGIPDIRHNMSLLAMQVEEEMRRQGIPSVIFSPFTFVSLKDNLIDSFPTDLIEKTLETGATVIVHGDVCFDETRSASILSGDTIAVYLAKRLTARAVLIGTDVDGVLRENPKSNPDAELIPIINHSGKNQILAHIGPSSSTDVTGGMAKKIDELLELSNTDVEIAIFNLLVTGRLTNLLQGKPAICTKILVSR